MWRCCSQDNMFLSYVKKSKRGLISICPLKNGNVFRFSIFYFEAFGHIHARCSLLPTMPVKNVSLQRVLRFVLHFHWFSSLSMWLGSSPTYTYELCIKEQKWCAYTIAPPRSPDDPWFSFSLWLRRCFGMFRVLISWICNERVSKCYFRNPACPPRILVLSILVSSLKTTLR